MISVDKLMAYARRLPLVGPQVGRRRILPLATAALLACTALVIAVTVLPRLDPVAASGYGYGGDGTGIAMIPRLGGAATSLLVVLLGVVTLGLGALAMAYLLVALGGHRNRYARGTALPWRIIILVVAGMLVFYFLVALMLSFIAVPEEEPGQRPLVEGEGEIEEEEELEPLPEPLDDPLSAATRARRSRIVLLGLLAVGFGAAIYFAVRLMRATPEAEPIEEKLSEELRRDLAEAAELAIAELEAEQDFRRAVIGCWAYLEMALRRHEHPREVHQTPLEYIRALVLDLPALPARALLELATRYEVARFSEHAISRDDRDTALQSLHDIRHKLRAA